MHNCMLDDMLPINYYMEGLTSHKNVKSLCATAHIQINKDQSVHVQCSSPYYYLYVTSISF
nr:MAG TPA: hypothetical protein [Caudoviricetes sp.]